MTGPHDARQFKIGEVARCVGLTARTIRYYEELGLLGGTGERGGRAKGTHRLFTQAEIDRLRELVRLRDLLGLSLDELTTLADTAQLQQCLRNQWAATSRDDERCRIIQASIPHVERQRELVRSRLRYLTDFAAELDAKLDRMHALLTQLGTEREE